jgi:hypothetical protein
VARPKPATLSGQLKRDNSPSWQRRQSRCQRNDLPRAPPPALCSGASTRTGPRLALAARRSCSRPAWRRPLLLAGARAPQNNHRATLASQSASASSRRRLPRCPKQTPRCACRLEGDSLYTPVGGHPARAKNRKWQGGGPSATPRGARNNESKAGGPCAARSAGVSPALRGRTCRHRSIPIWGSRPRNRALVRARVPQAGWKPALRPIPRSPAKLISWSEAIETALPPLPPQAPH